MHKGVLVLFFCFSRGHRLYNHLGHSHFWHYMIGGKPPISQNTRGWLPTILAIGNITPSQLEVRGVFIVHNLLFYPVLLRYSVGESKFMSQTEGLIWLPCLLIALLTQHSFICLVMHLFTQPFKVSSWTCARNQGLRQKQERQGP